MKDYIKKSSRIETLEGEIEILKRHTKDQYLIKEYFISDEGELEEGNEELVHVSTLQRLAKEADGKNHNFIWEE